MVNPAHPNRIHRLRSSSASAGWVRAQAARDANGRIRPGHALIDGELVKVTNADIPVWLTFGRYIGA